MNTAVTKRDLVERGVEALLEKATPSPGVTVQHHAGGGVSQVNLPQVVEVAKFMAACQEGVPPHCRGNVGICLRVTFQAVEWQMSPFSVADMSFIVNGRLGYQSQLLHAVIEGRAPLMHRLECEYLGKGEDMSCIVRGMFITGDVREYESPPISKIRVKNSPLWKDDPKQQLFYFASRSWARKWCPDVLLGCYTKEEIQRFPKDDDQSPQPGLHARLAGSPKSEDGHKAGHAAAQLDEIENCGSIEHDPAEIPPSGGQALAETASEGSDARQRAKRTSKPRKGKATAQEDDPKKRPEAAAPSPPSNVREYIAYARAWIKAESDKVELGQRWGRERKLRNALGVTAHDRAPLEALMQKQLGND